MMQKLAHVRRHTAARDLPEEEWMQLAKKHAMEGGMRGITLVNIV